MADLLHLVDKPEGWTSHDAVARVRRILGERRVGHAGTLDPFASGLLVLGEGRATSLLGCVALLPKRYVARACLGVETDTHDRTGRVLRRSDALPSAEAVREALGAFRGRLLQRPPLFSAVKVRGERLYKAARRGEAPEREQRTVHVYALELLEAVASQVPPAPPASPALPAPSVPPVTDILLDLTVSRGTYVRALAHDLGVALGCGAHLTALRRVAIGPFLVGEALDPAGEWESADAFRGRGIAPERALSFLPRVRLDPKESEGLRHGRAPVLGPDRVESVEQADPLPPGESGWPLALVDGAGSLVALARPWEEQRAGTPASLLRVLGSG